MKEIISEARAVQKFCAACTMRGQMNSLNMSRRNTPVAGGPQRNVVFALLAHRARNSSGSLAMLAAILRASSRKKLNGMAPWRLHDLRRTAATMMGELGILPHIVEAVLNHISGHKAGVTGVYLRAKYADEMRSALQRWADRVDQITA